MIVCYSPEVGFGWQQYSEFFVSIRTATIINFFQSDKMEQVLAEQDLLHFL